MNSSVGVLIGVAPLILVAACALFSPNLVEQGTVRLDIKESKPVSVTHVTAYHEGGITIVRGEAAFSPWVAFGHFIGHIDIEIDSPGSEVLKKRYVPLMRKRLPKKRGRRANFISRIAFEVSKGTTIKVSYHEGDHANSG